MNPVPCVPDKKVSTFIIRSLWQIAQKIEGDGHVDDTLSTINILYRVVCQTAHKIAKVDLCIFFEYIPTDEAGFTQSVKVGLVHKKQFIPRLLQTLKTINNIHTPPDLNRDIVDSLQEEGIKSSMVFPLEWEGRPLGVLFLCHHRARNFDSALIAKMNTLAFYAAHLISIAHRLSDKMIPQQNFKEELVNISKNLLDLLGEFVAYSKATLQLIQGNKRTLMDYRGFTESKIDRVHLLRPISQDELVSRMLRQKRPLILRYARKNHLWDTSPMTLDVKSWVGIPLIFNGQHVGLFTVDHNKAGFYKPEMSNDLLLFSILASVVLGNTRLLQDINRHRDLDILNRIASKINGELNTEDLLINITREVAKELECSRCAIYFPDPKGLKFLISTYDSSGKYHDNPHSVSSERSLAGRVFTLGRAEVIKDARDDEDFAEPLAEKEHPRAMILSPIMVGKQTIGVITADQDIYSWFDEADLRLLEAIAQQAGSAIQRDRAFELLQKVGSMLNTAQKMQEILELII